MLDDDSLDAVAVVTPVATHHELAMRALEAGKHVFVEKPLAPSSDLSIDVMSAAYECGLVLMPGHTFLYSPPVNRIRDLIRSGELGEIYFISTSRVNLGLHQSDVSVIWDLAPHDFSILLYWLEERPTKLVSMGRACLDGGTEDVAFIMCKFDSGTVAHVELSWLAPSKLRRTTVVGSNKMVVHEDGSPGPVRIFDSGVVYKDPETFGEYHLTYRTGDIASPRLPATEPIAHKLTDFVGTINGRPSEIDNIGVARKVVLLAERAEASLNDGGA